MESVQNTQLGRNGYIQKDGILVLECGFAKPSVRPVLGVERNRKHELSIRVGTKVEPSKACVSRSDKGSLRWDLEPGIYKIEQVQDTSQRLLSYIVKVHGNNVIAYMKEEEAIKDFFSTETAIHTKQKKELLEIALRVMAEIPEERKAFPPVVEDGIEAAPAFLYAVGITPKPTQRLNQLGIL